MSRNQSSPLALWTVLLACLLLTVVPLPDLLHPLRPPWLTMAVIYWAMMWPRLCGVGTAFVIGLLLDVLQGSLLGQHALALSLVCFITLKLHLQIRIFPLWQMTMTVFALLAIDTFIVFWVDGIVDVPTQGLARWTQILVGAVLWPPVMAIFDRIRLRSENRRKAFA
jgi:rod shape-determining protein MreD